MSEEEEPLQFARLVWPKRFNHITQTAYIGPTGDGKVFAVGVLGSVTLDWDDLPHCARLLRDMADMMEQHHHDSRPKPLAPQPRSVKRGGGARCQQPSTRHGTSRTDYSTCDTPLDKHGQCANAAHHVEL